MRIALGSDHRGCAVKARIAEQLRGQGHEVTDLGTHGPESVDYPDIAFAVADQVGPGTAERGILVCGSGIGMSIAANKVRGVRAALCLDDYSAEMSRRHNDANVLCLSGDVSGQKVIDRIVDVWLTTPFEGGRHARRLDKIAEREQPAG
jgi:ribose 5-phosphate isomerase B